MDRVESARDFIESLPHGQKLGLRLVSAPGDGRAEMELPYRADLVGDPATGVIHGGAVSALLDTVGGTAVMTHPEAGRATATLDLRIDYMRPATPGQALRGRAECYHVTRSVAFVRGFAFDDDPDNPVAAVTGAYTVSRVEGRP